MVRSPNIFIPDAVVGVQLLTGLLPAGSFAFPAPNAPQAASTRRRLPAAVSIDGVSCAATSAVHFRMDGRLSQCLASKDFVHNGSLIHNWAVVTR